MTSPFSFVGRNPRPSRFCAIFLVLSCALGFSLSAEAALSAKSYVQQGLIGQLDGIDNAGTGSHVADTNIWKDLAGDIGDFTVNGSCASFTGGNALKKNASGYMAENKVRSSAIRTIEAAVSGVPSSGWVMAFFGSGNQYLSFGDANGSRSFVCDNKQTNLPKTSDMPSAATMAVVYVQPNATPIQAMVIQDGVRLTETTGKTDNWGDSGGNNMSLGGRTPTGYGELPIVGYSLHAVRLYNRPLTADEAAANALVDAVRYRGASEAELDAKLAPHGFRITADGVLHRRAVLKACTATGQTKGTFTVYGQLRGHQEGSTAVTLLWGTGEDALDQTVAVKTLDVSARPPTFSTTVQATAGATVYWKLRAVNTQGTEVFTNETAVAAVRCAFLPETLAEPVTTVTLTSGQTTYMNEWVALEGNATPTGVGSIVVTGDGSLSITNDVLKDFTGNVYIQAGSCVKTCVANPLGAASSGAVYVEKGATLNTYWTATSVSFGNKPVYAEGTGTDGKGAIYGTRGGSENGQTIGTPSVVHLTGDMKIGWNSHARFKGTVDLHGHTYTVQAPVGWDYFQQTLNDETWMGHLNLASEILNEGSNPAMNFGDSDNHWIISGGTLRGNYGYTMKRPCTVIFRSGTGICTGSGDCYWAGPVYLTGATKWSRQNTNARWTFNGIISGPGSIGTSNNNAYLDYIRLNNAYNDFTGGACINKANTLELGVNGSLPANGDKLTCENGGINFLTVGPYALPEAVFSSTGLVRSVSGVARATGSWKKVTKQNAGLLVYDTSVGAPELNVTGGTFQYPAAGEGVVAPPFDAITVAAGATLDANGNAIAAESLGGSGTVKGDVTLATGFSVAAVPTAPLTVEGNLALGENAIVHVADIAAMKKTKTYTIATATTITAPATIATDNANWQAAVVGNELKLYRIPGTMIIVK